MKNVLLRVGATLFTLWVSTDYSHKNFLWSDWCQPSHASPEYEYHSAASVASFESTQLYDFTARWLELKKKVNCVQVF